MTNLTKYDLALIGIRLLTIYLVLRLISLLPSWLMTSSMIVNQSHFSYPFTFKFLAFFLPLFSLLIPILLWVLSAKCALFLIREQTPTNDTSTKENRDDLQAILFRVIGIFVLIITIPELITWIYIYYSIYLKSMNFFGSSPAASNLIQILLKILLSIILLFTAKGLSEFFYKLRYMGHKK